MTAVLLPNGKQQYFTTAGLPAVGYKIATFDAGTSNPRTTWQDALKVATNTNPVILDGRGEASIFWDGAYKVQLQDSTGAVIWTQDNLQSQQNGFSATLVPSVTNTFDLGSATLSWRNLYLGPNNVAVLDPTTGNIGYYARTSQEISAAVLPINFAYPPGNVFRYYSTAQITQTTSFSSTPTLDCSAAINNAVKCSTGDVFFPTGVHYIAAPIYIPTTAAQNIRFVGESRTNTKIEPMANNIADQLNINAMIINQQTNGKFSLWRIRLTTGDAPALQTAWAGFSLHADQPRAWSSTVNYVAGAIVTSGGNTYICIASNINQIPPNASFWLLSGTNGAGFTAAACNYIFSGSIEDCWFDAGGVQPMFVGGLNNYHVVNNTFEFEKGCFSITGGTADAHWVSNSLNVCFDYFVQNTMNPNANIISIRGLHAVGHQRGLLFAFINSWSVLIDDIHVQGNVGNLGNVGIGTFITTTDLTVSNCVALASSTLGTGAAATQLTFQACTGQISDCTFDGVDIGILLTGSAANRLSFDHVDIVNTTTAAFRVQTGTPSGTIQVSNSNWSNCNGSIVLFSSAGAFDFYMNDCVVLNAGLTVGAGARNFNISTTGNVRISDCQIGQNNGSAAAGFYVEADGAGPGVFEVIDPKFVGTPPTGLTTGSQTITLDGVTGTWTPAVGGTATYTLQQGTYSVNGKCVSFWGRLTINAIGTGSQTTITGLPFTNNATFYGSGVVPFFQSAASSLTSLGLTVAPATSQVGLRTLVAAAASTGTANVMGNATDLIFGGSYQLP